MALSITSLCISCSACKLVCPENAIRVSDNQFTIVEHRCNECSEATGTPQCASICPVENAILDANGISLNPTGSLAPVTFNQERILALKGEIA
ncbi:4Fe-4S binding protein [Reinekea marinisedimentorum]|uniref:4Fe-4S binding protein n=1 Tax=Reinekea marinisedimentorum TaxID=230495 RepID=A0A4R3HZQ9_9GAMM|nr:4Fe-4S binding protein [Reinekea marinisedimentorum]TCS38886.1 4Fe-4S binding protein [Reinekea marinisedimentorum]